MFDLEDSGEIMVTILDEERLKDIEIGGRVEGECGFWVIFRNKYDYLLTIDTNRIHKILEFKTLQETIEYLKES